MSIHHPTGITVEIVGIEASGNGRSCDQHDVCGSVLDEDVVVRLRKVQIINSSGKEETAIAAHLVSDGIDQCRVGFLQRHFVAHARSFDGVLAQVTEVYSITSDSSIKRKKCRHSMGCCLAALISELPKTGTSTTTTTRFLKRLARQDEEEEEVDTTRLLLQRNEAIVVYDDPPSALPTAAALVEHQQQTATMNVASTQPPPPAIRDQQQTAAIDVASTPPPASIRAHQHSDSGGRTSRNDENVVAKRCRRE